MTITNGCDASQNELGPCAPADEHQAIDANTDLLSFDSDSDDDEQEMSDHDDSIDTQPEFVDISRDINETLLRKCVVAFVEHQSLNKHNIDSYNHAMTVVFPSIIAENAEHVIEKMEQRVKHQLSISNLRIQKPRITDRDGDTRVLYPHECRSGGHTYSATFFVDIRHREFRIHVDEETEEVTYQQIKDDTYRDFKLFHIPAMTRSVLCNLHGSTELNNECPYDVGGLFLMKGVEKVVIAQEITRTNRLLITKGAASSKVKFVGEVRSCHEDKMRSTSTLFVRITGSRPFDSPEVLVEVPYVKMQIPLVVVFKLLGVRGVDQMVMTILDKCDPTDYQLMNLVKSLVENDVYDMDNEELCCWIAKIGTNHTIRSKRIQAIENVFSGEVLPHIGLDKSPETFAKKAAVLGNVVKQLCLTFLGRLKPVDRDDYEMKRVSFVGALFSKLFRRLYKKMLSQVCMEIGKTVQHEGVVKVLSIFKKKKKVVTTHIRYAMNTGKWGMKRGGSPQSGVAQIHNRVTQISGTNNLRRVNVHIPKEGRGSKSRQLHRSHYGKTCATQTPDGKSCLTRDTRILLANGQYKRIADLVEGKDLVVTVNPKTLERSNTLFTDLFTIQSKKLFEIETISGKKIKATHDHPFLTKQGWTEVQHLKAGTLVCIYETRTLAQEFLLESEFLSYNAFADGDLDWNEFKALIQVEQGCMWMPLRSITQIDNEPVMDFTTLSDNHSFVAEGFVTHNCGHHKYLTLFCHARVGYPSAAIINFLTRRKKVVPLLECDWERKMEGTQLLVNGILTGYTMDNPVELVAWLREARANFMLPIDCSITYRPGNDQIEIISDPGCLMRPIIVLRKRHLLKDVVREFEDRPLLLWMQLLVRGIVQFVDADEEGDYYIATTYETVKPEDTHLEFHPTSLLGVAAGLNPYADHNHAPRAIYQTVMDAQAMGASVLNAAYRYDTISNELMYGQKPIAQTMLGPIIGKDHLHSGQNAIIAVVCDPFNQEDSNCLKKDAIDRGLFVSSYHKTYKDQESEQGSGFTKFEKPDPLDVKSLKSDNYNHLMPNGMPKIRSVLKPKDVLIGKTLNFPDPANPTKIIKRDNSMLVKGNESVRVDQVVKSRNKKGHKVVKVKVVSIRRPDIGDKFCLTPEHQVLTDRGWIRIDQVNLEDKVATLKDGQVVYDYPTSIMDFNHEGPVIHVESAQVSLMVTQEHKMWVRRAGDEKPALHEAKSLLNQLAYYSTIEQKECAVDHNSEASILDYQGSVHCIEVPSHVFYVRRNGKAVWTGNSARHGQKGITGIQYRSEDMLFCQQTGVIPDVLLNPHCFPSRMTLGLVSEIAEGTLACHRGVQADATLFQPKENLKGHSSLFERISADLKAHGFSDDGCRELTNGTTGTTVKSKIFMGPCHYQRLKHVVVEKIHCVTPDHEVLTRKGWKKVEQMMLDDEVAILKNGRLLYEQPLKCYAYDYQGKMMSIESDQLSMCVTPNHKLLCSVEGNKLELIEAEKVAHKRFECLRNVPCWKNEQREIDKDHVEAFVMGAWIAIGRLDARRRAVMFECKNQKELGAVSSALDFLNIPFRVNGPLLSLIPGYERNSELYAFFDGMDKKRLPRRLFQGDKQTCREALNGILIASGSDKHLDGGYFQSLYPSLVDDVQQLMLHAGYSGTVTHKTKKRRTEGDRPLQQWEKIELHRCTIVKSHKGNRPAVNDKHTRAQWIDYDGPVYCLEVSGGIFYTRRHGKPHWTGNSRSRGPRQILTRQPVEGRSKNGGFKQGEMERVCARCFFSLSFVRHFFLLTSSFLVFRIVSSLTVAALSCWTDCSTNRMLTRLSCVPSVVSLPLLQRKPDTPMSRAAMPIVVTVPLRSTSSLFNSPMHASSCNKKCWQLTLPSAFMSVSQW